MFLSVFCSATSIVLFLFRFKNGTDLQIWKQGLSDWKDFNSDFGNIYPNGLHQDTESAAYARASQSSVSKGGNSSNNANNATDLSQIVVDQEEDDEDNKGVRPLMKVSPFLCILSVRVIL